MASPAQGFMSTPAFELFRRGLIVETIKRFRGINVYQTFAALGPDWAQDCLNVIVGSDGGLHKFRLPQTISPNVGASSGPQTFIDFQQANGTRQVLAFFGAQMVVFTVDMTAATTIETNPLNAGLWSLVSLKNFLFGTNGQRMQKWLGTPLTAASWQQIGINAPTAQPTIVLSNIVSVTRAANVVTVVTALPIDLRAAFDSVIIAGVTDPSFNGVFQVAAVTDQTHFTYNQTAANASSSGGTVNGTGQNPNYPIASLARVSGVTTATVTTSSNTTPGLGADFVNSARKLQIVIAGAADGSFNGTFTVVSKQGNVLTFNQSQVADLTVGAGGTLQGTFFWATGMTVGFAYVNTVTGHISNGLSIGGAAFLGPFPGGSGAAPRSLTFTAPASPDPQVNAVNWYRTLDGGGDFFFVQQEAGNGGKATLAMPDSMLDQTQRMPLINNPPIQGKFMTVGQGRLFVANLNGAPQDIEYSGYEQILTGNPPESFPVNNRLRLSIGAESINGIGVLQNGVVAFSQTNRMYMLRGQVQDITTTQPVVFTQFLQELPWQLGCLSHWSIQATPYGLVWLAADKTVQFFDGSNPPQDISKPAYSILRSITVGTEGGIVSAYFNWLDRDLYALAVAVNGSQTNNRLYIWSLESETQQIEMFVADVQADYLAQVTTSAGIRELIIAQGGRLKNLPVAQDTSNGLVSDLTIIPPTNGQLNAYWRSHYAGNQSPEQAKMWRWLRLITDQSAFLTQLRLVDDESSTFLNPQIKGPYQVQGGKRLGVNRRAKRMSVEIDFPVQDVSANVIEMQIARIATGQR